MHESTDVWAPTHTATVAEESSPVPPPLSQSRRVFHGPGNDVRRKPGSSVSSSNLNAFCACIHHQEVKLPSFS